MEDVTTATPTPPSAIEVAEKLADQAKASALGYGVQAFGYDPASERKLQIFHSILTTRTDLSVEKAAEAALVVFQKLCIPQAPSA